MLALRDVIDEDLGELSPEDESTSEERAAMRGALTSGFQRQLDFQNANRPRVLPPRKPLVSVLRPPSDGAAWAVFRKLPAGLAPGVPVQPLHLHGRAAQYELHVGFSYIPASDWDGDVPPELADAYARDEVVVTAPGDKPRDRESFPLLFSRARSIVFATRAPVDHVELDRIAKKLPAGDMREAAKQLHAKHAPKPAYAGAKNVSVAEQKRAASAGAAAKAAARAVGDLPADAEAELIAAHMPNAQQAGPVDYSTNSFGKVGSP